MQRFVLAVRSMSSIVSNTEACGSRLGGRDDESTNVIACPNLLYCIINLPRAIIEPLTGHRHAEIEAAQYRGRRRD
jgi:hypothetical protein